MDAGRLISLILGAGERAKEIIPYFFGKPYTATTVSTLDCEVHKHIEGINRELRKELGIELYVEIIPTITDTTVQGYLKVRRCGEFLIKEEIGVDE